jgi:hypothetical protein
MTELATQKEFGTLGEIRGEIIETLNNPDEASQLKGYFKNNECRINDEQYYCCNGDSCDSKLARIFATIKYIAQPFGYCELNRDCPDFKLSLTQKSYYHGYHLPVEEIQFVEEGEPDFGTKILISGGNFAESKSRRVEEFGLEDFVIVLETQQ